MSEWISCRHELVLCWAYQISMFATACCNIQAEPLSSVNLCADESPKTEGLDSVGVLVVANNDLKHQIRK